MTIGPQTRNQLVEATTRDAVGPFAEHPTICECLKLRPSRWYLTGFLAPQSAQPDEDPTDDENVGGGDDVDADEFSAGEQPEPKQKQRLPASLGLSVLLRKETTSVTASVQYADYERIARKDAGLPEEADGVKGSKFVWRRLPPHDVSVEVPLDAKQLGKGIPVPDSGGLYLKGTLGAARGHGLPAGTQALSLFLVNSRPAENARGLGDRQFVFQVSLELRVPEGILPRPNRRDERSSDRDERILDLQFRNHAEYAVGHGVAVELEHEGERCVAARSCWIPRAEVKRVVTFNQSKAETSMEALAQLTDGGDVRSKLGPLADEYAAWIKSQRKIAVDSDERRAAREAVMDEADRARARIAQGVELLASDPQVLEAFKLANDAMARSARQRSPERGAPKWRLFQLAFVLLNLSGLSDDKHEDRALVELIFFPTGGGKTEAYLGVIAFTLLLRRMRGQERPDGGLGVAVLLRYTLRLLTLDQLGRAATLICALEQLRATRTELLGQERFTIGLWVGRSATANTLAEVEKRIIDFKNSNATEPVPPSPLTQCPWCGTPFTKDSFELRGPRSKWTGLVLSCANWRECEFSPQKNRDGLPVLFVDEQIYQELPCFLVATVDKFAMLPWRAETGMLFGRVSARDGDQFVGCGEAKLPSGAMALPDGLRPPELIVQDELHLISGPLGTMVGLYETAVEALCTAAEPPGTATSSGDSDLPPPSMQYRERALPKIIASTATVRRAEQQIRALFNREMAQFPPPGVDDSETFFATVDKESPGRLYIGIAAGGRNMKAILLRTYVSLLAAAQKLYDPKGAPDQPADAYMTLVGYFNSLRELGGMRRLVEDEVRARAAQAALLRPEGTTGPHPWFSNRDLRKEPVELTSRESTANIARSKARLAARHAARESVDVALASNMISVGVDIDRLGLMVVAGQPKTTSEYIQASSRVGRQHPGLVVTVYNLHKPRDRSHYERFTSYHESFYRSVEATSLTPFSGPALERGLAGTLVAMARHGAPELTPPLGFMHLKDHAAVERFVIHYIASRGSAQALGLSAEEETRLRDDLTKKARNLFDAWRHIIDDAHKDATARAYSRYDRNVKGGVPLLWSVVDPPETKPRKDERAYKFAAPTSMRDVEPSAHLWLQRGRALGTEGKPER
ncbi:MAG: DISARM system helicase DrmA [Myxococcales bacterium]|nr:DISARM system helicase DrmA [Myxococcales bacterium]MCB9583637.1 helicase [Polyangiaceae bacterium]